MTESGTDRDDSAIIDGKPRDYPPISAHVMADRSASAGIAVSSPFPLLQRTD